VNPAVQGWADRLEALMAREQISCADRVAVLATTTSTQDAAHRMAAGRAGLLVVAGRQTSGRGRLGRAWVQAEDLGLPFTLVLDAAAHAPALLAMAAGLAAARAIEGLLIRDGPATGAASIGLRWPNDVVTRGDGRKLAGVLVETRDGLALVGIGVNVLHRPGDWPAPLRGRAVSLHELGSSAERIDVAERLLVQLDRLLRLPADTLIARWRERDVLSGCTRTFLHDGRQVHGRVVSIEPTHEIVVLTDSGEVAHLPALSTSMVHEPV
jgi:BirA family transcriptional regulator, biotin operon repressor / biotin---[acetyl-CoA-carboxylase] ligase